jgi:protein-disulfide isomerase
VAAGVLSAAIAIAAGAIVISSSGGGTVTAGLPTTRRQAQSVVVGVNALLAGIPQSGQRLGRSNAPVSVTYYGDLQCPYCAAFTLSGGFSELVADDVRRGRVKVVYRSLCSATCNDPSGARIFEAQQIAAYAAGIQHRFWHYAELFYRQQGPESSGYVTQAFLAHLASQTMGLNLARWRTYLKDPFLVGQLQDDDRSAGRAKVRSTPTLIVTGPHGTREVPRPGDGVPTYAGMQQTIEAVS